MPRYKVTAPTFVCNNLQDTGTEVEYAGWPGSTLDPLDDVAKRVKEHFVAHRRDRKLARMPDLTTFADPAPTPAPAPAPPEKPDPAVWKPEGRKSNTVKDNSNG